jgi:hypothetical protein
MNHAENHAGFIDPRSVPPDLEEPEKLTSEARL